MSEQARARNQQERDLLRDFRALPENDRNRIARQVAALALLWRAPAEFTLPPAPTTNSN